MKCALPMLALLLLLPLVGCSKTEPTASPPPSADDNQPATDEADSATPGTAPASDGAQSPAVDESAGSAVEVEIQVADWEQIQQLAKAAGRPTVVDVWALSCQPCMEEFPGLVQLHNEFNDRLQCMSANVDFDGRKTRPPESYEPDVRKFLTAQQATFSNFLCSTPSDDVFSQLEIPSIPAVLVFDAEGNEAARFVDAGDTVGFTYEKDVVPFVRQLLGDNAGQTDVSNDTP